VLPPPLYGLQFGYVPPVAENTQAWVHHRMYTWWTTSAWNWYVIAFGLAMALLSGSIVVFARFIQSMLCPIWVTKMGATMLWNLYFGNIQQLMITDPTFLGYGFEPWHKVCDLNDISGLLLQAFKGLVVAFVALFVYPWRYHVRSPIPIAKIEEFRSAIRKLLLMPEHKIYENHSHPTAASQRNSADDTMNQFIIMNGYKPYSIQLSKRDKVQDIDGSLFHYWPCDQHSPQRCDKLEDYHVIKMCNVDYYVDYKNYMWTGRPMMLFTFTPRVPCGAVPDYNWTTNSDNTITMKVCGGGTYTHELWNYNVDFITARYPGVDIIYSVESVPVFEHWSIIMLTPHSTKSTTNMITSIDIKRLQIVHSVYVNALEPDVNGRYVSAHKQIAAFRHVGPTADVALSDIGATKSILVSSRLQGILAARVQKGKTLEEHEFNGPCAGEFEDVTFASHMLFSLWPRKPIQMDSVSVWTARDAKTNYRRVDRSTVVGPPEKPTGVQLFPAVIAAGFLPTRCLANDLWMKEGRIDRVANPQVKFEMEYEKLAAEFLELFIPTPHLGEPVDVDEVIKAQIRPTQRANNKRAAPNLENWFDAAGESIECMIKSFQKAETYPQPKDPRNISTLPTEHCLWYSRFTRAIAARLKKSKHYAFGKHPDEIAKLLYLLAQKSKHFVGTDFSRFDGTHSTALTNFELAFLLRFFHPRHHHEVRKVHGLMSNAKCRTTFGLKYGLNGTRPSGASDTSIFNTVDNMFVAYCVLRKMGFDKHEAFKRLGIYGGDDGLTPDATEEAYEKVCSDLGLKIKAVARPVTDRHTFLGRIYPNPFGMPKHCADIVRQLSKTHMFPSRAATSVDERKTVGYNKALGYLATDPNTPILSRLCHAMMRTTPPHLQVINADYQSYIFKEHKVFKSAATRDECIAVACTELGIGTAEIERYEQHLDSLTSMEDLQPLLYPVAPTVPEHAVVGPFSSNIKRTTTPNAPALVYDQTTFDGESKTPTHNYTVVDFVAGGDELLSLIGKSIARSPTPVILDGTCAPGIDFRNIVDKVSQHIAIHGVDLSDDVKNVAGQFLEHKNVTVSRDDVYSRVVANPPTVVYVDAAFPTAEINNTHATLLMDAFLPYCDVILKLPLDDRSTAIYFDEVSTLYIDQQPVGFLGMRYKNPPKPIDIVPSIVPKKRHVDRSGRPSKPTRPTPRRPIIRA